MDEKIVYLEELYRNEALHKIVYSKLSEIEKEKELKSILEKLSKMEERHKALWGKILSINRIRPPAYKAKLMPALIILVRRIVGLALTVKFIGYFEEGLEKKFDTVMNSMPLSKKEAAIVKAIYDDETKYERVLEEKLIGYGKIFNNIRDVAFGMNDGLVEILGVIVGLAAAITNPLLIVLGGIIVSVAGTLSMGGGAYLSTEYENSLKKGGGKNSLKSGFYVGIMYFIGTLFPLSPFLLGIAGFTGIALSIIATAIVLTVTSAIIAIISNNNISRMVGKTLLISLGIAAITIAIGVYARSVLNLPV
jgi:VIT1/CCC1 family predicted Fe2+/Mn2+ transporter